MKESTERKLTSEIEEKEIKGREGKTATERQLYMSK